MPVLRIFCVSHSQVPYLLQASSERYRQAIDYLRALSYAQGDRYVEEIATMMQHLIESVQHKEQQPTSGAIRATRHHDIVNGTAKKILDCQKKRFQREQDYC
jgi:hypothetical protein